MLHCKPLWLYLCVHSRRPVTSAAAGIGGGGGAGGDWTIPQNSKLKYTQMFNMHDRTKRGHLTGNEARAILTQSGLTHNYLAQIW